MGVANTLKKWQRSVLIVIVLLVLAGFMVPWLIGLYARSWLTENLQALSNTQNLIQTDFHLGWRQSSLNLLLPENVSPRKLQLILDQGPTYLDHRWQWLRLTMQHETALTSSTFLAPFLPNIIMIPLSGPNRLQGQIALKQFVLAHLNFAVFKNATVTLQQWQSTFAQARAKALWNLNTLGDVMLTADNLPVPLHIALQNQIEQLDSHLLGVVYQAAIKTVLPKNKQEWLFSPLAISVVALLQNGFKTHVVLTIHEQDPSTREFIECEVKVNWPEPQPQTHVAVMLHYLGTVKLTERLAALWRQVPAHWGLQQKNNYYTTDRNITF